MKKIKKNYLDIHVDTKNNRIFFPIKKYDDAELHYQLHTNSSPTVIEFTHTFVPSELRNQGVASKLVEKGLRLAKANHYDVQATCPFVEDYIRKHPEFQSLEMTAA